MSNEAIDGAIAALERSIKEAEQKIRSLRSAINTLCEQEGRPPRYGEAMLTADHGRLAQIQDDTFYGKKQTPAMREYLEMRKAQGQGPATPREFYEALKTGGYQFEAQDDTTAIIGLRGLLRTQPHIFHRLPQGTYGLTEWYPDAKRTRDEKVASKKGAAKRKKKARAQKPPRAEKVSAPEKAGAGGKTQPSLKVVDAEAGGTPSKPKAA